MQHAAMPPRTLQIRRLGRSAAAWIACAAFGLTLLTTLAAQANETGPLRGDDPRLSEYLLLSPAERVLFSSVQTEAFNEAGLFEASLVASGVQDAARRQAYQDQLKRLIDRLQSEISADGDEFDKALAVFEWMHKELLYGGYDLKASSLAEVLDHGKFNCVSSVVLYQCLCRAVKISAYGIEVPAHAFCGVQFADRAIDVETTCPTWFEVLTDPKRRQASLEEVLGSQHNSSYVQRRKLSPAGIIAILYYNRGVEYVEGRQFALAVDANLKALLLDPASATSRGNLLAAINNWALDQAERGEFEPALEMLERGIQVAPEHDLFHSNRRALCGQWLRRLCDQGEFDHAAQVAQQQWQSVAANHGLPPLLDVYRQWGTALAVRGDVTSATALFHALENDPASQVAAGAAKVAMFEQAAQQLAVEERFDPALRLLAVALSEFPNHSRLTTCRRSIVGRWHTQAVETGDYVEAVDRIHQANALGALDWSAAELLSQAYLRWAAETLQAGELRDTLKIADNAQHDPLLRRFYPAGTDLLPQLLQDALAQPIASGELDQTMQRLDVLSAFPSVTRRSELWQELQQQVFRALQRRAAVAISQRDSRTTRQLYLLVRQKRRFLHQHGETSTSMELAHHGPTSLMSSPCSAGGPCQRSSV